MKKITTALFLLIGILSCSEKQGNKNMEVSNNLYIDSVSFRYYKKKSIRPYLLSSKTYAFNDSMSQVLDTLAIQRLIEMNSTDRSFTDPLSHTLSGDTLMVDLIYSPLYGRFPFGSIRLHGDSLFILLSGDVSKDIPKISEQLSVPNRYYKSEFKILVDTSATYNTFFRDR